MDGRTDGQTDESDFTGRSPSDVVRPIADIMNAPLKKLLQDNFRF